MGCKLKALGRDDGECKKQSSGRELRWKDSRHALQRHAQWAWDRKQGAGR